MQRHQRFVLIKKGQKGGQEKAEMFSTEFALEMQGKSEANHLIAGSIVRLFLLPFRKNSVYSTYGKNEIPVWNFDNGRLLR